MKIKRITAALLALLMLLSVFGCAKKDGDKSGEGGNAPAVWSDTIVVTKDMFVYFYNGYYRYFLETYSASLENLGLDPSKALSQQQQSEEYTWQQYITLQVYRQLREMIALADSAKAEGIELDDKDLEDIESQISAYDKMAADVSMEVDEYIVKVYGKGVTKDVMRDSLKLRFLANKYYEKLWGSYKFSDEECLDYYEKNRNTFVHFDYLKITVPPEDVKLLEEATDKDSFVDAMRAIITKNNFLDDYDRFSASIEEVLAKKIYYRADFDPTADFCKWLIEEDREAFDIYKKKESTGNVTVAMILPTNDPGAVNDFLYRDDVPVKNLKYMVFDDSADYSGKVKADSIYKNWQEKPTAERFDELIAEYDGGDAEGVTRGMFNDTVNEWVFAEGRKVGDSAVIEVDGGAYILYMLEDGDPSWMADVRNTLRDKAYEEDVNKAIDKYPTSYDKDIVYNIVEVSVVNNTETAAPKQ